MKMKRSQVRPLGDELYKGLDHDCTTGLVKSGTQAQQFRDAVNGVPILQKHSESSLCPETSQVGSSYRWIRF